MKKLIKVCGREVEDEEIHAGRAAVQPLRLSKRYMKAEYSCSAMDLYTRLGLKYAVPNLGLGLWRNYGFG